MPSVPFVFLARQLENAAYVDADMARGDCSALDAALDRAVVLDAPAVRPDSLPVRETVWFGGDPALDIRDGGEFVVITGRTQPQWVAYRAADLTRLPAVANFEMAVVCRGCRTPYRMDAWHHVRRPCRCGRHFKGMRIPRPPLPRPTPALMVVK